MPRKSASKKQGRAGASKAAARRSRSAVSASTTVARGRAASRKRAQAGRSRAASRNSVVAAVEDVDNDGHPDGWWSLRGFMAAKFLIALLILLPACYVTMEASFALVIDLARGSSILRSPEFWSFSLGVAGWLAAFVWLPRPVLVYVFGHEATHAVVAFLLGADVPHFKASSRGGYVYTTRSNFLISLAPYLFPFYTLIILAVSVFVTSFCDVYVYRPEALFGVVGVRWIWVIMCLLGMSWCFHLTFTAWMIGKHQPDLIEHGVFFSLSLIVFANLLLLCVFLVVGSPEIRFAGFWSYWLDGLWQLWEHVSRIALGLFWLARRGIEGVL